jgi:GNAT superfamily N-acetyltransferase
MDTLELAATKWRLAGWLDSVCRAGIETPSLSGPGFAGVYVSVDPDATEPAASGNFNRVTLCGAPAGVNAESVERWIALFRGRGVERFFVWLLPGPGRDEVAAWLSAAGLKRGPWTNYPTLVRDVSPPAAVTTDLTIREVDRAEVLAARAAMGEAMWPRYVQAAGAPGFTHFLAFDGETPMATAALAVFEGLGYLSFASTAEAHRRRGAQQALIAARIDKAAALGCRACFSDTLTMLKSSLANLRRAGFEVAFETEVYVWEG